MFNNKSEFLVWLSIVLWIIWLLIGISLISKILITIQKKFKLTDEACALIGAALFIILGTLPLIFII